MKVLSSADRLCDVRTAAALGIFDGVHRGHQAVMGKARYEAEKRGLVPAVFTFAASTVSTKGGEYRPIYADSTKLSLFEREGAEYVYIPAFSDIKDMGSEEFAIRVLKGILNAGAVICGRDFRMGKGASCGTEELADICGALGIHLTVVDDISENGIRISSADIRRLITEGQIKKANTLLGREYAIEGEVVYGRQLGRTLDFPTANIVPDSGLVTPAFGVYSSLCEIDGTTYRGVTDIGVKPTVRDGGEPLTETYFIGYKGGLYGRTLSLRLTGFIRPEMKFPDINALREQIDRDVKSVMSGVKADITEKTGNND